MLGLFVVGVVMFFFKFTFLFSTFIFSSSFYFICKKKKQNCSWLCAFKNPFIQIVHQQFLSISWKLHITEWKVKYFFFLYHFFWKVIIKYCMMNKKNCLTVYVDMHSINCMLIPTCFSIYIYILKTYRIAVTLKNKTIFF